MKTLTHKLRPGRKYDDLTTSYSLVYHGDEDLDMHTYAHQRMFTSLHCEWKNGRFSIFTQQLGHTIILDLKECCRTFALVDQRAMCEIRVVDSMFVGLYTTLELCTFSMPNIL